MLTYKYLHAYTQISIGRASMDHYSSFCRSPVFCHDELICKMMAQHETLELCLLASTSKDAAVMVFREEEFRQGLLDKVPVLSVD